MSFKQLIWLSWLLLLLTSVVTVRGTLDFSNEPFLDDSMLSDMNILASIPKANKAIARFFSKAPEMFKTSSTSTRSSASNVPSIIVIVPSDHPKAMDNGTLKWFIKQHIIPGVSLNELKTKPSIANLNRNLVQMSDSVEPLVWTLNGKKVASVDESSSERVTFIFIDGYLDGNIMSGHIKKEKNKVELSASSPMSSRLKNFLRHNQVGTKVFEHFLNATDLIKVFEDDSNNFIVFIPADSAFQRWQPLDWGFFPFSVPDFTENILKNHIVFHKKSVDYKVRSEQRFETIGGESVAIRYENNSLTVNNVTVLLNDSLAKGRDIFVISEVLFMSDAIVSKLHQKNKDKETPPLLAFPWFSSQFLSHAFLALEKDPRFKVITRFLGSAEIASRITGSGWTFFVPSDDAFEKYELNDLPDDKLSSNDTLRILLNHFVGSRLYKRDLRNGTVLTNVNGLTLAIRQHQNVFRVNQANIVESEVFVYNLGTMYFIDDILFPERNGDVPAIVRKPISYFDDNEEASDESLTTEIPIPHELESLNIDDKRPQPAGKFLSDLLKETDDVEFIGRDYRQALKVTKIPK